MVFGGVGSQLGDTCANGNSIQGLRISIYRRDDMRQVDGPITTPISLTSRWIFCLFSRNLEGDLPSYTFSRK